MNEQLHEFSIGSPEDFSAHRPRMIRAGDHRLLVVKTETGFSAISNACPHQGYGLMQGAYDSGVVTCQWHNWKFDIATGACLAGEEDVDCHVAEVRDGEVIVTIRAHSPGEMRAKLWPSFDTALREHRVGQLSRDTARLLRAQATPAEIVVRALADTNRRNDYGFDHGMATASDCLALTTGAHQSLHGDDRVLALAQALDGLSDDARHRTKRSEPIQLESLPENFGKILMTAIDNENIEFVDQLVRSAILLNHDLSDLRQWMIRAASQHHYDFGHQAIYVQKAFELIDLAGAESAIHVVPTLAYGMAYGTKEDVLPYMVHFNRALGAVDLGALASSPTDAQRRSVAIDLANLIVDSERCPVVEAVEFALSGGGVQGMLDAVVLAGSLRLTRYDDLYDRNGAYDFRWLDITHVVTYAHAARWAWRHDPCPDTARLALYTLFLAHDSGRGERHGMTPVPLPDAKTLDLADAIMRRDARAAVAAALTDDPGATSATLTAASLQDGAGSFIVQAHIIKLTAASIREFEEIGNPIVLAGAAAFSAGRRLERFVAGAAQEAIDFIRTGQPPKR